MKLYNTLLEDSCIKFVLILCKYQEKYLLCRHEGRSSFECPGGRVEEGENIYSTAQRELYEETGAINYVLKEIADIAIQGHDGVICNENVKYGRIFLANVTKLGALPDFEIQSIAILEDLPDEWTYPEMEPILFQKFDFELKNL